jgi:hypothetical protein
MLESLIRFWTRFCDWMTQRPPSRGYHLPPVSPYMPSNLHARRH